MYAKVETITPERAKELLQKNPNNRKPSIHIIKKYAADIKNGAWKENGESISISKSGQLKNGQHRLFAIIQANMPLTTVVVYDVEDNVNEFDRNLKRSRNNILQMNGYPPSICNSACVGAVQLLLHEASYKNATDSQFMKVVDNLGHVCNVAMSCVRTGINHPISLKSGCVAAAIVALFYGIDEKVVNDFFTLVNTGFAESKTQYAAIVVRNYLLGISGYGSGAARMKENYITTLKGILDYANGVPRKFKYDLNKMPPMATAMTGTIKDWLES